MMTHIKNNIRSFSDYTLLLRRATKYCFVGASVLFACYIYFVGAITFSVVERQALEESTKELVSDISIQELHYLAQEKQLTKEVAYTTGLIDAPSLAFTAQQRAFAWNAGR
jgi:hypothetical protein